jgi:hypothetical protein
MAIRRNVSFYGAVENRVAAAAFCNGTQLAAVFMDHGLTIHFVAILIARCLGAAFISTNTTKDNAKTNKMQIMIENADIYKNARNVYVLHN